MTEHIHARQQIAVGMPHQAGAAQTGAGKAITTILRVEIVHHRSRRRPGAESAAATAALLHRLHLQRIFRIRAQSGDRHRTPGHRLPEDSGTPRRLRNRHRIPVAARRQPIRRHPGAGRRKTANIHLSAIKQRRAVGSIAPARTTLHRYPPSNGQPRPHVRLAVPCLPDAQPLIFRQLLDIPAADIQLHRQPLRLKTVFRRTGIRQLLRKGIEAQIVL